MVNHLAGSCEWTSRQHFDHAVVTIRSRPVHLIEPTTFMNDSGLAVSAILQETDIPLQDIIVLVDDIHLDMGRIRIRRRGSDGGHNGLRSILSSVGSDDFPRLRLGVGRPDRDFELIDHVLSDFDPDEMKVIEKSIRAAADAVTCWCSESIEEAMNRYNAWGDNPEG